MSEYGPVPPARRAVPPVCFLRGSLAKGRARFHAFQFAAASFLARALFVVQAEKMPDGVNRPKPPAHVSTAANALRRLVEDSLDKFFGDGGEPLALLRRNIWHFRKFFAQQG